MGIGRRYGTGQKVRARLREFARETSQPSRHLFPDILKRLARRHDDEDDDGAGAGSRAPHLADPLWGNKDFPCCINFDKDIHGLF